ncbi:MAG: branched-chain amino acid ABC transporter permease [Jatrophihabitans sp.]|uniref:branched-chain amino acid ABC transporter permease n=1 Tax=Jatrophihabitans sp. TaxID=1932789 RepID=UPI0039169400
MSTPRINVPGVGSSVDYKGLGKRLLACLIGSLVLALMIGDQEGSDQDYGLEFRTSLLHPRVFVFLAIGLLGFVAITFWPTVKTYIRRPGVLPLVSGTLAAIAGLFLMKWYDGTGVGDGKFGGVRAAVDNTSGLNALTSAFFSWLAYAALLGILAIGTVAIIKGPRRIGWAGTAIGLFTAVVAWRAHNDVVDIAGPSGADHSLGYGAATIGYVVLAFGCAVVAVSKEELAASRAFVNRVFAWRPGSTLVALGLVLGLVAFMEARWFDPNGRNSTFSSTYGVFQPAGLTSWALAYLHWLGWVLFGVTLIVTGAGVYLRSRPLAWVGFALGVAASIYTVATMYKYSDLAAGLDPTLGTTWNNLGTGTWIAAAAFLVLGGGGYIAATSVASREDTGADRPVPVTSESGGFFTAPGATRTLLIVAVAFALFYPPTATSFWQKVLVSEVGIYVLLAVGLNVVVGWAGLLDLGFIAFYAIGSYTTAYFTGSLPIHPPSWLTMSPLLAIPFAVAICLLAGLALGAPTLRLRGDYLAIVTLGFGEIIRIIANNADNVTNGSRGTAVDPSRGVNNVPNPAIHLGPLHVRWGQNQLQYWYLLLVFVIVVVVAFRRLENSRIGRAWAAIREDEVAAQASGVNTFRIKLLAFAIGASTSGLAGVFFASQIGFFNPDNFVLNNSILVVAYVVFGGMGSLPGAMAGAALLTWLPEFLKDQVPANDRQMWIGAVVLLMMIFRPSGLIPAKRRRAELEGIGDEHARERAGVPARMGGTV